VQIEFDPEKRNRTLAERGLDFVSAAEVFRGPVLDIPDERQDYGEPRTITFGFLRGRMVALVWTPRGAARRIISMRYANDREIARLQARLGGP
jgi:uncharacterized DUF497 family protein